MRTGIRAWVVALAASLVLAGCADSEPEQAPKPQYGTWGVDTVDMDETVRPGDDFFDYAVGSWIKTAQIAADEVCAGVNLDVNNRLTEDIKSIVQQAAAETAPDKESQQIGDLYASYMDEAAVDARGVTPVKPYLDQVDAVTDRLALDSVLVSFNATASVTDPFPLFVAIDPNKPTRYLPETWQGGLSLSERDYYLQSDPDSVEIRDQFVAHVAKLLGLAGYRDAESQADQVLALETKLAQVQWPLEETLDVEKTNTIMARGEVEKLAQGAPLKAILDALKVPAEIDMNVGMPDVLAKTAQLFATEPVDTWKAYLRYQVLSSYGSYLSKAFSDELFDFYARVLYGSEERQPRWKDGIYWVSGSVADAVGQRYVAQRFAPQTKDDAVNLVENFRKAYSARIDSADWMSPATKKEAQAKLTAMVAKIGYPEHWQSYDSMKTGRDDLVANSNNVDDWWWAYNLGQLAKPIDRAEWITSVQTNNAFYDPQLNDITFPAGILQPPFFDPAADPAANYGAIGATIGHEMSHAFDNDGRKADSTGALRDWWTPDDAEQYEREAAKLVGQFDAYEPVAGEHINGELTLGENIADLAGLQVAYDAYQLSLAGQEAPVIDGLTGDQRFFIAYAFSWKDVCREETVRNQLLTDTHSPSKYRVNGIVRNMDEWYAAFDVKEGDKLYLKPEDRVRIW